MSKRKRRSFTPEFKTEALALVRASGKNVHQVAKDLDLTETALWDWVQRASEGRPLVGKRACSDMRLREGNRALYCNTGGPVTAAIKFRSTVTRDHTKEVMR